MSLYGVGETYHAGFSTYNSTGVLTTADSVAAPPAPSPSTAATGGTIAAGTYYFVITYVSPTGETVASAQGSVTTTGTTSTITIPSPPASTGATGWNAYGGTTSGSGWLLQGATNSIGTALTLLAPLATGTSAPPTMGTALAVGAVLVVGTTDTTEPVAIVNAASGRYKMAISLAGRAVGDDCYVRYSATVGGVTQEIATPPFRIAFPASLVGGLLTIGKNAGQIQPVAGGVDVQTILGTASKGAAGYVGIDWSAINAPTTAVTLSGTTILSAQSAAVAGTVSANVMQWLGKTPPTPTNDGVPIVDTDYVSGDAVAGAVQAAAATSITLESTEPTNISYANQYVSIVGGTGYRQCRRVVSSATDTSNRPVLTISPPWDVIPDTTSRYQVGGGADVLVGAYGTALDPASMILATPGNKLATTTQGGVTLATPLPTFPANFPSLVIDALGNVSAVPSSTAPLPAPRDITAIADSSLTPADAAWAALSIIGGEDASSGSSVIYATPGGVRLRSGGVATATSSPYGTSVPVKRS